MRVINLGVGRTGTLSLKHALERLGFGPCHHMLEVEADLSRQVPLWTTALDGNPDWRAIYRGYGAASGWPTAAFAREVAAAYPRARFLLSVRDPASWADSFLATTARLIAERDRLFAGPQDWLEMLRRAVERAGFRPGLGAAELGAAFAARNEAVRGAVPPGRLLVWRVEEGWGPLCDFLGLPVPSESFPHRNDREEYWRLGALEDQHRPDG